MRKTHPAATSSSHAAALRDIENWFANGLGCVPGQREFKLGRYMYELVRVPADVRRLYNAFRLEMQLFAKVGCLFVLDGELYQRRSDAALADILAAAGVLVAEGLGLSPPMTVGTGCSLSATLTVRCPVTNRPVAFDDFDAIAFVPQAADPDSPYYDPNIAAPFVCVNFTSDLYGFSAFTRDRARSQHRCEIWEMADHAARLDLFDRSAEIWQRLALKTISNFAGRTDPRRLCPMHASADEGHWFAMHEDAAFGEMLKRLHRHEMPKLYTRRIIERWRAYYETGTCPHCVGIAPKGHEIGEWPEMAPRVCPA